MVTKRITSSPGTLLMAKLYFFFRRSIWRYLLATILLGIGLPISSFSQPISMLLYFLIVLAIALPAIWISAQVQGKRKSFDAEVTFSKDKIVLNHNNKDLTETKDWSWIKKLDNKKLHFMMIINQYPSFGVILSKENLTAEEIVFFTERCEALA